ncbi:MAG: HAMP domain-containing sensor histidine kinase [Ignavibacteriaceae bacterium]|nr:HAMP domain-containing sensor histidine kinase [Ignavibacteriaceae bacterium]
METAILPVLQNRLPLEELESDRQLFSTDNIFAQILNASPTCLIILNKYRQIVYLNKAVEDLLNNKDIESAYGKRPGELLNCQCSVKTPDGCSTSEFCETCGALKAIMSSLNGEKDVQECRIIQRNTNEALDLRVWAEQLKINGRVFSIFSFIDISNEKRRLALERIFFHDVLNSAQSLISCTSLLKYSTKEEIPDILPLISDSAFQIVDEIKAQRDLSLAEISELSVNCYTCNTLEIIKKIKKFYDQRFVQEGKEIQISPDCESIDFVSDELLITRVLGNMLKNALESTKKGSLTTISSKLANNQVRFSVNNSGFIPLKIQYQIFQRSFTTKGSGRGLGTYSMKLLSERYLKGKVSFTTSEKEGITFFAEYPLNYYEHD